jgi:membrane protein implicated in regulation of membrane protease activity
VKAKTIVNFILVFCGATVANYFVLILAPNRGYGMAIVMFSLVIIFSALLLDRLEEK